MEFIALGQGRGQTANVSKKRGIMLAAVLAAVLGGLLWHVLSTVEPEPVYQGKRLSAWLEDYVPVVYPTSMPTAADKAAILRPWAADNAVRHIGTNAIPTLLRLLRARDSTFRLKLIALTQKQHFIKIHFVPASERNRQAGRAFLALGSTAKDALPALLAIYEEKVSAHSQECALLAVVGIGPDAKPALPLLLKVASDTNTPDPEAILVRRAAICAIGSIHGVPRLAVPVLIKALSDQDREVRYGAVWALVHFGADAKPAVPALFELLKDPDSAVRLSAISAIERIDPEAATQRKAEIDAAIAPVKLF